MTIFTVIGRDGHSNEYQSYEVAKSEMREGDKMFEGDLQTVDTGEGVVCRLVDGYYFEV